MEGKTIGALVSEVLAAALSASQAPPPGLSWTVKEISATVDLEDKDAVYAALDAT